MARRNYDNMMSDEDGQDSTTPGYEAQVQAYTDIIQAYTQEAQALQEQMEELKIMLDAIEEQRARLADEIGQIPKSVRCTVNLDDREIIKMKQNIRQIVDDGVTGAAKKFRGELGSIRETQNGVFVTMRQVVYWILVVTAAYGVAGWSVTLYYKVSGQRLFALILVLLMLCLIIIGIIRISQNNR